MCGESFKVMSALKNCGEEVEARASMQLRHCQRPYGYGVASGLSNSHVPLHYPNIGLRNRRATGDSVAPKNWAILHRPIRIQFCSRKGEMESVVMLSNSFQGFGEHYIG
jgi:hypothetical protein